MLCPTSNNKKIRRILSASVRLCDVILAVRRRRIVTVRRPTPDGHSSYVNSVVFVTLGGPQHKPRRDEHTATAIFDSQLSA